MDDKIYIGDAVYVERVEGGNIRLTTENGIQASNVIVMEPAVLDNFENVLKRWREDVKEKSGG